MPQAIISLGEHEDRVINILKGKFGFKNKSEVINMIIDKYENEFLEPALRPEYKAKLTKIMKGKHFSRKRFEKEVR
tara:strand:+ start:1285 stop:1512 length:228 start_codon:yes stop_codon:yes gene_type:complete